MPDNAPIPTINSISINGEDYQIEDTAARARADALALSIYEVGDLYFSMNPTSPAARFGGEWEQLEDVFIRAANDTETGGSDAVTLTQSQLPNISGSFVARKVYKSGTSAFSLFEGASGVISAAEDNGGFTPVSAASTGANGNMISISFGENESHSIMPAFQNVYVWQRVA